MKRNVPCSISETSTPPWLSFDTAVIAYKSLLPLPNLPSFWLARKAPSGRIHSVPLASVSSCNIEMFDGVAMGVRETGLKLKPSKRLSPLSVPIQRYPSAVCVMALTAPPGNLVSVVHCSRTYSEDRRLGSSARASVTRPASTIPIRVHRLRFNRQIMGDTRICRLQPHFRFSVGYGLDEIRIRRCAPIGPPQKAHRR